MSLPGQVVVLHPDETHDGRAGTRDGFGYRIVYVAPARIEEAARAIRGRPDGERIPLVAVTGWGQEEDRRRVREAGFDHHLVKPADIGALRALLGSL